MCKQHKITHNCYDRGKFFRHSITVDGDESLKVKFNEIARNGNFCAVTSYYSEYFPEIFLITNFSSIANKCTIQDNGSIKRTTKVV